MNKMLKKKNHIIISIDSHHIKNAKKERSHNHINRCRELSDKIQHLFMTKAFNKVGIEGNFPNLRKNILKSLQLTPHSMVKNLKFSH